MTNPHDHNKSFAAPVDEVDAVRDGILIVDDDPAIAELQRYILTQSGFSVQIASSVSEAVDRLERGRFEVVILDYRLPDGSPWRVLDAAKACDPEVPVVMVTAGASESVAAEATRRGVAEYAIKGEAFWNALPATMRRIVNRKHAEMRMRSTGALFHLIENHTADIITIASVGDGSLRYISAACKNLLGYESADLLGRSYLNFIHPDDRPVLVEFFAALERDGHARAEYRYLRSDGSFGWIESNGSVFTDRGCGHPLEAVVVSRDVTDRKAAEESLRQREAQLRDSEEQYRRLVESVEDYAILRLDAAGRIASWTTAAQRIKGYTQDEILGKRFSCLYTPEDILRGHPEEVLRIAEQNGRLTEEGERVRKDGSRFWAAVSITAIRDGAGKLQGFSKVTRDITERVKSEERIRQDEEMFRALLESAPDALIIADQEGKICLVNAQAERLFGHARHEMEGQTVEMLIPGNLKSRHEAYREAYGSRAKVRQMGTGMELKGLRQNGSEFPVEVSLSPIKTSQGSWVAAAIRDITERKLVEEQLVIARQRAEEASQAKSDFLATVSHEIRTPMNAILGMSDLLSETNLTDEQRKYVTVFGRAGSNLMALINDILDLSKIEAGRLELDETEFNLRELVDQTVELIAPKAQAKRLALRARVLPEVAAYLAGDPARLRQILVNLLGNAVKFTDSGQLGLTVKAVDSGIEFAVSDTGIGIPEHQLASIFQAFKQGDPSITRRYGGTGLGLGISRRLVEAMGGQLSVTSVVGVGSTFQFVIPLQPVKHNFEESPAEIQDLHGRRVALVDSDATSRMIMRETLAVWGLETQEFSTADDALTALAGSGPEGRGYSLAIIDRWMPAMDGFELAKKIRALLPALPVIMLASEDRPGDEIQRRMAGLTGYAIRPVGRTALLQLLSKAQRQSAPDRIAVDTPAKSQKPLRILVVEDSEDNQLLVQLYTENTPHLLSFAGHGEEALALLNAAEFDIVLMDLQMPVMDGLTATRRIRQIERERGRRAIPIIALSANARPQDIKASIEAGCNAHLSKPISKRRLLAALEQYAAPAQEDIDMLPSPRLAALVPKYLENRRKDLQRVVELHSKGDFAAIHGIVHNIKGTGTSYGFPGLTTLGAAMQASAESVDADALRVQIQELAALLTSLSASAAPPEPAAGSVK